MCGNCWQYGKWRIAEYIPVRREKSPMWATMPGFSTIPAICCIVCYKPYYLISTPLSLPNHSVPRTEGVRQPFLLSFSKIRDIIVSRQITVNM